jgi:hypothetical protein
MSRFATSTGTFTQSNHAFTNHLVLLILGDILLIPCDVTKSIGLLIYLSPPNMYRYHDIPASLCHLNFPSLLLHLSAALTLCASFTPAASLCRCNALCPLHRTVQACSLTDELEGYTRPAESTAPFRHIALLTSFTPDSHTHALAPHQLLLPQC